MIYPYACENSDCRFEFDVIKGVKDIEQLEYCPKCGTAGKRLLVGGCGFICDKATEKPEFCPALGKVVKNNSDRRRIAKSMGLEEVGTEPPEKLHKHFEEVNNQLRESNWANALEKK